MSHSLRVKIKGLQYKGVITDKDCDRLCKALDNEEVLDKIREEIKDNTYFINEITEKEGIDFETVEKIIDKYRAESEDKE